MKNAYIIDFFLSGMLMIMLFYLYVDFIQRLKILNKIIDSRTLAIAIGQLLKQSIVASLPLVMLFVFLLWRFYAVIVAAKAWGVGAAGLLVIVCVIGVVLIWLDILLVCIKNSRFVDASKFVSNAKNSRKKIKLPDPNTPLSEVGVR